MAAIGIVSFTAAPVKAQVSLSINIGSQPQWGPRGYNHVDYYYLPDVESYYCVPTREFVYLSGNRWIHNRSLPYRYRGYDLYGGRKVVINSPNPWMRHNSYRTQYVSVRNNYNRYNRPSDYYNRSSRVVVRNDYRAERYENRNNYRGRQNFQVRGDNNRGRDYGDRHDRGGDRFGRRNH